MDCAPRELTHACSRNDELIISYTDTCNYLGNTICSHDENVIIDNAITHVDRILNNVLAEFSHYDSGTLSTLFNTYCMNIYGCHHN